MNKTWAQVIFAAIASWLSHSTNALSWLITTEKVSGEQVFFTIFNVSMIMLFLVLAAEASSKVRIIHHCGKKKSKV
jgi:hypothetical protein